MESSTDEITFEFPGFIRLFKDGRFERLHVSVISPAGVDPSTGVTSKDIIISPKNNITARLYLPKTPTTTPSHKHKLPLLIYYHGGGFSIESTTSAAYHTFLNLVVSESNIIAVSVDYRLAPEFPLPVAFDDSWEAIKWVAEHVNGNGPDPWLNEYADFQNIFLAGDSAGGNIAHNMGIRVGSDNPGQLTFRGAILLNPYFWGKEPVGKETELIEPKLNADLEKLWCFVYPGSSGLDDPLIDPGLDPKVAGMGCSKILVFVGGKDFLRERNWYYKQVMEKNGWKGELEMVEYEDEGHCFFLFHLYSPNACTLRNRICTFINQ